MRNTIVVLGIIMVSFVFLTSSTDVSYGFDEKPCSVSITSHLYQITHNFERRSNPDGSVYPGDGFHYIFSFEGSDTCQGFHAHDIKSEGAFDIISHDIITGTSLATRVHSHDHYEIAPKYMRTTHYHELIQSETPCINSRGYATSKTCYTAIPSENPIFSVREDQKLTSSQQKKIFKYVTTSQSPGAQARPYLRDDITTTETFAWGLTDVGAEGHTHGAEKHVLEDNHSISSFENAVNLHCTELKKNSGCVWGHIEIDTDVTERKCLVEELEKINVSVLDIEDECVNVKNVSSLTVQGTEVRCYYEDGKKKCENKIKKRTADIGADILSPVPATTFGNPSIRDTDGYDSKNKDSTYYVWDVPAVHVQPEMPFRELRNGTISFGTVRTDTTIPEIFSQSCHNGTCSVTVSGDHVSDTKIDATNGDRIDVFRAEVLDEQGLHTFPYTITVYNIGREIGQTSEETDILIADYSPIFSKDYFAHVILDSPGSITFEKQHGVSLYYLGSNGTGPDDVAEIHPDRRSKINDSHHKSVANTLSRQHVLNSTVIMMGGEDIADMVRSVYPSVLESSGRDTLGSHEKSLVSVNDTAVFTNSGFGRMAFYFEGLAEEASQFSIANVTLYNTLDSSHFGGYDKKQLYSYRYNYPGSYVSSILNVTSINSDGTTNQNARIDVKFVTDNNADRTMNLPQYMSSHISHASSSSLLSSSNDTNPHITTNNRYISAHAKNALLPDEFAQMYLGDMHDIKNAASGTGAVIEQINLPAIRIIPETYTSLGITDERSFTNPGEEFAYSSPVSYQMHVTAEGITNVIPYYPYGFSRPINYTINSDDGNTLEYIRYLSSVHVRSPDSFGEIKEMTINGIKYDRPCTVQCLLRVEGNGTIHAENIWGGTATLEVTGQTWNGTGSQYEIVMAYVDNAGPTVMLVLVLFTILFMYVKFARSR